MDLRKGISFWGVFSIASGAMISSGLFILPGLAFSKAGPAVLISYLIAGILALMGILSIVELITAMPKAGGDYYIINKTFGPMLGTISGFLGWFALSLKSAFAIFGISEIIYLYTGITQSLSALLLCIFFVSVNIKGIREAAIFQIIMVFVLISSIVIYIIIGLPQIQSSHFKPFLTGEINEILITSGFIFISFGGLLKVANISEEVINPKRNIPLGMISSVIVVTILYTLVTYVITGTLNPSVFKDSLTPVADSAKIIMGNAGYIMIIIASLLAFFTTANAGIMSASRYPLALSRDQLLPSQLSIVHGKYKTPVISTIITGIIIYLSLLLPLEVLVKSASTVILTSYVLTNISVIILRESKIINYKPSFKTPFYPFLQIFSFILFTFFIVDLGKDAIEISLIFLFLSFCVYIFYGKKIKSRESALLHLMKRITDNRLTENIIEDELREILINRDNIEQDNFDKLIKESEVIDIDETLSFENLLNKIVNDLTDEIGVNKEELISLFLERQKECNTAISDFLAIPHIIIDGENKMFMRIIRCRSGIKFTENENSVKAVFLFGGTQDKRVLHLKTIMSMATLVENKDFQKKWIQSDGIVELKNLMILSSRKRFY